MNHMILVFVGVDALGATIGTFSLFIPLLVLINNLFMFLFTGKEA